ncbi:MAG TPA: prepilin peptidase [Patescibacteria group bacterium]
MTMNSELFILFVLGLGVGSFLTLVSNRIDTAESILVGRSHCNHCKEILRWWELVPFVSFVLLQGRCIRCKKQIPPLYPFFELITALTFVGLRLAYPATPNYWIFGGELVFVSLLLILFFYDVVHQAFPTSVLFIALGWAVIISIVKELASAPLHLGSSLQAAGWWFLAEPSHHLLSSLAGGIVGAGLLGLIAFPSKGLWMGYGDVILAGILGIWLGYPFIIITILAAFYSGAIIGGIQLATKRLRPDHRIAFGPFLIVGALITTVWGDGILLYLFQLWGIV